MIEIKKTMFSSPRNHYEKNKNIVKILVGFNKINVRKFLLLLMNPLQR